MKKLLAFILAAVLLTAPVLAGWEIEANNIDEGGGGVAYTIGAYTVKPVLDGKLDGDGAYTKIGYRSTDLSYAWSDDVDNSETWAKELKFEIYASYDASNIYIMVVSDANHYFNEMDDGDGNAWQYSCIQVSLADSEDEGTDRLEYGIWRKSNDGGQGSVIWGQHPGAKAEYTPNYAVALEGGRLYYETVVPVNTFLNYDSVAEDDKIGFNVVVGQADKDTVGHVHTQYSSGCTGNGKNSQYFAKITLGKPINVVKLEAVSGAVKLQGELIGSEMGWGDNTLAGRAAAFDGDKSTFFDPAEGKNPEYYVGMKSSEPFTLTEIRIHPREGQLPRFNGASIWGFNGDVFDPYSDAVQIWESDEEADDFVWQVITADKFFVKDPQFTHFAYFNERDHGDVAEVELYGIPLSGLPGSGGTAAVDDSASGGGSSAPDQPVVTAPVQNAPKTGDNSAIFALLAILSLSAAFAYSSKKALKK